MATEDLKEQLIDYIQDAHALEKNSKMMLESIHKTTDDPQMRQMVEHHIRETEQHEARVAERLKALGADSSQVRDTGALLSSALKGVVDRVRTQKPSKNARDGYLAEQMEIVSYELLQRLAERAGDQQTAEVARTNLQDEKAMAEKISQSWDKVIDLTVEEIKTS